MVFLNVQENEVKQFIKTIFVQNGKQNWIKRLLYLQHQTICTFDKLDKNVQEKLDVLFKENDSKTTFAGEDQKEPDYFEPSDAFQELMFEEAGVDNTNQKMLGFVVVRGWKFDIKSRNEPERNTIIVFYKKDHMDNLVRLLSTDDYFNVMKNIMEAQFDLEKSFQPNTRKAEYNEKCLKEYLLKMCASWNIGVLQMEATKSTPHLLAREVIIWLLFGELPPVGNVNDAKTWFEENNLLHHYEKIGQVVDGGLDPNYVKGVLTAEIIFHGSMLYQDVKKMARKQELKQDVNFLLYVWYLFRLINWDKIKKRKEEEAVRWRCSIS